jgi:Tfp pilus assembly protein PilF
MSSRNTRPRSQPQGTTRQRRPGATSRPAGVAAGRPVTSAPVRRTVAARAARREMPIDVHRLIASVALALLLVLSLSAPGSVAAPDTAPLVSPRIDGSGTLPAAMTSAELEAAIFPYLGVIERSQGSAAAPENVADVLRFEPSSLRARRAMFGQIIASSSGNINQALVDTGFFSNLTEDKLQGIEETYRGFMGNQDREARGLNGLSATTLYRSFSATGTERLELERTALGGFQSALESDPQSWQFTYNWALANLIVGNYAAAYDGMRGISATAAEDTTYIGIGSRLGPFWMGLAALRGGDPGEALAQFTAATNLQAPQGANDALRGVYDQVRQLGREGLADAQWANRNPAAAYKAYYETLLLVNTDDTGLYRKWLRLGLQQRAYDSLAADLANLAASTSLGPAGARLHHDRARLLTFLGRLQAAEAEYREAIRLGEGDPSLDISYGQALESRGDHNGALAQAENAIRRLGKDPASADLTSVARAAVTTTTSLSDRQAAQQLLDATVLRARAWGKRNDRTNLTNLVSNLQGQAGALSGNEAGLLQLYAGLAAEAGGALDSAHDSYGAAWDTLRPLAPGTPGRAAALAGLVRVATDLRVAADGSAVSELLLLLKSNGYDPVSPPQAVVTDPDAPAILAQGGALLQQAGRSAEAANALRVAALVRNIQDARQVNGVGRPLWYANGTVAPANALLQAAGAAESSTAALRYREAFSLDPALAAAWNNLGVLYAQQGNPDLAASYLGSAGVASPGYAWGQHNLAALEYKRGIGNFFTAEAAQGRAIKAAGPQSLSWGYGLRSDDRGPLPAPSAPASDLLGRLPAAVILLLLLAHTIVGNDRLTNRMGLLPTRGVIGMASTWIDAQARRLAPSLMRSLTTPRSDRAGLLLTIGVPSAIGTLALAWAAGRGALDVALVYLPVALLAAVLAFGANELAQYVVARRTRGSTVHHVWPLGAILGVLSIPFSFVYGWQAVTRVQPAAGEVDARGAPTRRARTGEDLDLLYEAQAEAAAELDPSEAVARVGAPAGPAPVSRKFLGLSPAARILFAGLAANLVVGLLFGLVYWLTGWPSMRLGMFASMLVLAFTAVSEPPADGWTLYRRNAPLWLALFVFAAAMVTLLAAGLM